MSKSIELFPIHPKVSDDYKSFRAQMVTDVVEPTSFDQKAKITDDSFKVITLTSFHKQRAGIEGFKPYDLDNDGVDDVLSIDELEQATEFKIKLDTQFAQLPSAVRKQYNNSSIAYYQDIVNKELQNLQLTEQNKLAEEEKVKAQKQFQENVKNAINSLNASEKDISGGDITASS